MIRAGGVRRADSHPLRRGGRILREVGLAVLLAAVSGVIAQVSFDSDWGAVDCSMDSVGMWALLGGLVVVALVRLRFPASALVGAAMLTGMWPAAGGVLGLTAFHAAGRVRPERRLQITVALAVLADMTAALLTVHFGWTIVVAGHALTLLFCVGLPIGVQVLLGQADRVVAALRERAHYLEENYRLADSAARLQERSRIAQEMHDQLGHRLSLISLYAGALELATADTGKAADGSAAAGWAGVGPTGAKVAPGAAGADPVPDSAGLDAVTVGLDALTARLARAETLADRLAAVESAAPGSARVAPGGRSAGVATAVPDSARAEAKPAAAGKVGERPAGAEEARLIRGTVQAAMRELRSTLGMLRSDGPAEASLQPVEQTGTRSDLALLVDQSRAAGVPVELVWQGADLAGAPAPVRRAAHRLVREALTNIHRHAQGARAEVRVDHRPGRVRIEVVSGRPVAPAATPGTGMGLIGVQERVRLIGGVFAAGPTPDGSFRVSADLPLAGQPAPIGEAAASAGLTRRGPGARRRRDNRRGIAAVLAVGLAGLPALVSVVLMGASQIVPASSPFVLSADPVRLGMTRAELEEFIGAEEPLVRLAAKGVETPVPVAATCLYAHDWDDAEDQDLIVRYCFRDDRLSTVDRFPVGHEG